MKISELKKLIKQNIKLILNEEYKFGSSANNNIELTISLRYAKLMQDFLNDSSNYYSKYIVSKPFSNVIIFKTLSGAEEFKNELIHTYNIPKDEITIESSKNINNDDDDSEDDEFNESLSSNQYGKPSTSNTIKFNRKDIYIYK